ncbi:MAG: PH domain-containing protein, partial [Actinomycetota bacterium]|nr:PH domain-containing protein [Actinomycetota bacterium]
MSSANPSPPAALATPPTAATFRLPKVAYLMVLFLVFCVLPLAFTGQGTESAPAVLGPQTALLVIPVIAAIFIARNSTVVDGRGITVRLAFGSKTLPWDDVRGLSVDARTIYLVGRAGSIRLPCVRISDLA